MTRLAFDQPNVLSGIDAFASPSANALDRLEFGVIGFDVETVVTHYNAFESSAAGLSP